MTPTRALCVVGIGLVLAACESSSTASHPTETPSATAAARASQTPSPLPAVDASVACRLPISDGSAGSGGFITFPGGQFAADPASQVSVPGNGAGGRTSFGLSYDRGFHEWLPVPYNWVSPDGTRYAYPTPNTIVVVSVISGKPIQELTKAQGGHWWVVDVESNGVWGIQVYDSAANPPLEGGLGLYFFPYIGGPGPAARTSAGGGGYHIAVRGSVGYDTGHWDGGFGTPLTSALYRENFSNGQGSTIYEPPGNDASGIHGSPYLWAGLDHDTVFLQVVGGQLLMLPGEHPVVGSVNLGGDVARTEFSSFSILADAHGIWIAGVRGLYLLTPQGVERASDKTGALAGSCG